MSLMAAYQTSCLVFMRLIVQIPTISFAREGATGPFHAHTPCGLQLLIFLPKAEDTLLPSSNRSTSKLQQNLQRLPRVICFQCGTAPEWTLKLKLQPGSKSRTCLDWSSSAMSRFPLPCAWCDKSVLSRSVSRCLRFALLLTPAPFNSHWHSFAWYPPCQHHIHYVSTTTTRHTPRIAELTS